MKIARGIHRNRDHSRAQGMVEFALILPLLLLLLVGIIEFGYFMFIYSSVNSAAREAVRYGAAAGNSASGAPYYQDCAGIRDTAKRTGPYAGMADADIDIGYDDGPDAPIDWGGSYLACPADQTLGDRIVVRISVDYQPIVAQLGFPPLPIEVEAARTIVTEVEVIGTPLSSPTLQYSRTPTLTLAAPAPEVNTPTPTTDPATPTYTATVCQTPIELGGCE
jgi:hypothetical protein